MCVWVCTCKCVYLQVTSNLFWQTSLPGPCLQWACWSFLDAGIAMILGCFLHTQAPDQDTGSHVAAPFQKHQASLSLFVSLSFWLPPAGKVNDIRSDVRRPSLVLPLWCLSSITCSFRKKKEKEKVILLPFFKVTRKRKQPCCSFTHSSYSFACSLSLSWFHLCASAQCSFPSLTSPPPHP